MMNMYFWIYLIAWPNLAGFISYSFINIYKCMQVQCSLTRWGTWCSFT